MGFQQEPRVLDRTTKYQILRDCLLELGDSIQKIGGDIAEEVEMLEEEGPLSKDLTRESDKLSELRYFSSSIHMYRHRMKAVEDLDIRKVFELYQAKKKGSGYVG